VEHPAPIPSAQPWRVAALVAAAVATVELLILVVLGVAFGSKFLAGTAKDVVTAPMRMQAPPASSQETAPAAQGDAAKTSAKTGTRRPALARTETSVIVLNGNGISGAAATGAEKVRPFHYLIAGTDNAPRTNFSRSLVMYRPGYKAEARRLAKDIGLRRVVPLDGMRARDLQGAHIAYIIGG
jgi:hypothetical protein